VYVQTARVPSMTRLTDTQPRPRTPVHRDRPDWSEIARSGASGGHNGGDDAVIWDEEGGGTQRVQRRGGTARNVGRIDQQRQRLAIYRVGVARMRAAVAEGVPPIQAARRAGCQTAETFALDRRDAGMLVGSIAVAALDN
jgi:hypothetical protein